LRYFNASQETRLELTTICGAKVIRYEVSRPSG
jgi:hypothetical protein